MGARWREVLNIKIEQTRQVSIKKATCQQKDEGDDGGCRGMVSRQGSSLAAALRHTCAVRCRNSFRAGVHTAGGTGDGLGWALKAGATTFSKGKRIRGGFPDFLEPDSCHLSNGDKGT